MSAIAVIGGTGTLGTELLKLLAKDGQSVTVFSRDELKQKQLKAQFPSVECVLGDIRDPSAVGAVLSGKDKVFHVAALKHVDTLEENCLEAIKTNIIGTVNVAEKAVSAGVRNVVFCSTDKAVLPINAYGMSKAISEKFLWQLNRRQSATRFSVFRWGNVVGSRGSVVPIFVRQLREGAVTVTDARMTRFWLLAEDAARFMLDNYASAPMDQPLIPPMKAASVLRVIDRLAKLHGIDKYDIEITGIRPGEKIHECVFTSHDHCVRSDTAEQYSDEELDSLLKAHLEAKP